MFCVYSSDHAWGADNRGPVVGDESISPFVKKCVACPGCLDCKAIGGRGVPASNLGSSAGTRITDGKKTGMDAGSTKGTAGINGAGA